MSNLQITFRADHSMCVVRVHSALGIRWACAFLYYSRHVKGIFMVQKKSQSPLHLSMSSLVWCLWIVVVNVDRNDRKILFKIIKFIGGNFYTTNVLIINIRLLTMHLRSLFYLPILLNRTPVFRLFYCQLFFFPYN